MIPKASSTVILLAPFETSFRILMLKRGGTAKFMPNAYVFPGGGVDPVDTSFATTPTNYPQPPSASTALKLAALREVFEETGILITGDDYEVPAPLPNVTKQDYYSTLRGTLPRIHRLIPYSRWITPAQEKTRFDTTFYLCALRSLPATLHLQASEVSDALWLTPQEALAKHEIEPDRFKLPPPQYITLRDLASYSSIGHVTDAAVQRCSLSVTGEELVPTRQPFLKFRPEQKNMSVIFPGDEEHDTVKGEGGKAHRLNISKDGKYEFVSNL